MTFRLQTGQGALKTLLRNNSNKARLKFQHLLPECSVTSVTSHPPPVLHRRTDASAPAVPKHAELSGVSVMARHIIGVLHYIISNHSCRKFQVLTAEEPFIRDHHRPCGRDEEGGPTAAQHHLLF